MGERRKSDFEFNCTQTQTRQNKHVQTQTDADPNKFGCFAACGCIMNWERSEQKITSNQQRICNQSMKGANSLLWTMNSDQVEYNSRGGFVFIVWQQI